MKHFIIIFILSIASATCFSQNNIYQLANEKVVFSFKTEQNKNVIICIDSTYNYIVYRFGNKKKIELQYPALLDTNSWHLFTYDYYMRGGGVENAGLDLNSLSFENNGYHYKITDDWAIDEDGEHTTMEIIVTKKDNNKETVIKGELNTRKGSMSDLRFDWNDLFINNK